MYFIILYIVRFYLNKICFLSYYYFYYNFHSFYFCGFTFNKFYVIIQNDAIFVYNKNVIT